MRALDLMVLARPSSTDDGHRRVADGQPRGVGRWVQAEGLLEELRVEQLGFISVEYGPFIFDGICLRRSAAGKFILSFPARTDRGGRRHSYIRPASDAARQAVEREILGQLGQHQDARAEVGDG